MLAGKDQDDAGQGIQAIERELGGLRSAVEHAVAAHPPGAADVARARAKLAGALASFGSPEFDLEAKFHIERIGAAAEASPSVAIARALIFGEIQQALADLSDAIASPECDETEILKLTFSAVFRARPACPDLPWLKEVFGRVADPAERGASAIALVPFLPQGGRARADVAEIATGSVSALWQTSPEVASWLINATCRALVDVNDQPLLATTAGVLLRSLPPAGSASERNTLGYVLITSLNNVGDIAGSIEAMDGLLATLLAEPWDWDNFRLLTKIASVAAEAAAVALSSTANDLAVTALALADRAFDVIEHVGLDFVPDDERPAMQQTLNAKFSQAVAVARSLSQNSSLEITQPDPAPLFRFLRDEIAMTSAPASISPSRSARISEARFLEECARVDWKVIPTPQEVDFGLDYRVEIPDSPGRTSADVEFLVQLKSTSAMPNKSGLLTVAIDATTLKYWKSKVLPTLVALFHHQTNRFYTAWYLPALDDAAQRTFRFAQEDGWDPFTLQADVQRYYQHVRAALASGGDWSLLSVVQCHCALLIKTLLQPDVRRAALGPEADLAGAKLDQTFLILLSMHHRALCAPVPILAGQPIAADVVQLIRTLDAIVRSWTMAGPQPQGQEKIRFSLVADKLFFASCPDLLHVAVELDCALASAIVDAQESRAAALASAADEPPSTSERPDEVPADTT